MRRPKRVARGNRIKTRTSESRKRRKASSTTEPKWIDLPEELTTNILQRLGEDMLRTARRVCNTWRQVCNDPLNWRVIDMRHYNYMVSRCAVDLSQGQAVDISLMLLSNAKVLRYVSLGCPLLKRLRICGRLSVRGLISALERLPLLEELQFDVTYYMTKGFKECIPAIARACPSLRSFSLNCSGAVDGDYFAREVGQNMPNLRNVQLHGMKVTVNGLRYIRFGCLHLESLRLCRCSFRKRILNHRSHPGKAVKVWFDEVVCCKRE